ncbi:alpha/beta fold hydrolase [Aquimarina mytili]|uniref:Alpha/beta hydrolase n=1 Tax=Aquimarina mytili TaxID=874423 RepID=A0A937A0T8_9FLAO|nr:alpha/beta hydrolase [Aquimarina mytili]MBL0685410.1 alpha/beta hydrolase [Aquimarina mytili]
MILAYKGIKINYNTLGKGTPIVFLHGFLENSTMWDETMHLLSNQYYCISIDLLGHGDTECLGYIHAMEDMAIAVKAVLNHLEIRNVTLVGHSMGGYAALAFVDLFPSLVLGLALLNSTSFPDTKERKENRTRAIDIVKKNPNAYTSMAIANLFAEENRSKFVKEIAGIKNQAAKTSLQGIISALEGMKIRKDRSLILKHLKIPKVIFAGKQDPVLEYVQNLKESELCKTNLIAFNGGHMSYIENKKEFLSELQIFLETISIE